MTNAQAAALQLLSERTGAEIQTGRYDSAGAIAGRWTDERGSWRVILSVRGFVMSTQRRELAGFFTIVEPEECLRLS